MARISNVVKAALIAAAMCVPAVCSAQTAYFSGDDLYKGLTTGRKGTPEQKARADQAFGYMMGVVESRNFAARGEDGLRFCMAETTTSTSVELAVVNWLERNPKRRNAGAPTLIAQALAERSPCRH